MKTLDSKAESVGFICVLENTDTRNLDFKAIFLHQFFSRFGAK